MGRGRGSLHNDERDATLALPPGLEVFERRPDVVVATEKRVMYQLWRATATLESFLRCDAVIERFSAEHDGYITLAVIEPNVGAPNAEVRQAAARTLARFEAKALANVMVIEGTGFKHTGIRLAITTIQLLAPGSAPAPVFPRVDEACDWLATQYPDLSAAQLARSVAALRGL